MSLLESVKSAFQSKKQSSREEYQKALAGGKAAERVVALALVAGLTEAEIAEDARVVDRAAALAEVASRHPALAKVLADAVERHDGIAAEYSRAVDTFTQKLSAAAEEVETARAGETPARRAVEELAKLHRDRAAILPAAPPAVRAILDEQDREAAIARSREAVRNAHGRAAEIERKLLTARNESRSPGFTNRAMFQPAKLAGVVGDIQQPTIIEDHAEHNAKQTAAGLLEAELAQAQAAAQQLADAHAERFGEQVP